jgi:Helix-turn-helix domain
MTEDTSKPAPLRPVMWGRRFLAATVVVPPNVAELLSTDAMAVLAVIRDEATATGKCTLPVARIAERANIGRAKTRAAIRLAESLGLIAIEQEPGRERAIINRGVSSRC